MKLARRAPLAIVSLLVVLTACSGSGGGASPSASSAPASSAPASPTESATPEGPVAVPDTVNDEVAMPAGTYEMASLTPSFTFTIDADWLAFYTGDEFVQIDKDPTDIGISQTLIAFPFSGKVMDPKDGKTIRRADDLAAWLQSNPHVRVIDGPKNVRIDGRKGVELDLLGVKLPADCYYQDGSRCWNLVPYTDDPFSPESLSRGEMLALGTGPDGEDALQRLDIVDVDGATMVLGWTDLKPSFDDTVATYEHVLGTIRWS